MYGEGGGLEALERMRSMGGSGTAELSETNNETSDEEEDNDEDDATEMTCLGEQATASGKGRCGSGETKMIGKGYPWVSLTWYVDTVLG
jgi:hypothetical protein